MRSLPSRWSLILIAGLLVAGIFWLRWPSFGFRIWNVDEAIHAAVARTLLDGGVLYHDAIDQRTPLTYYAVAAVFAVCGENNIWAMHALAAALIAGTTFLLFLLARRRCSLAAALWAAALYAFLSTGLFYVGDAFALNTEWFVAFFTVAAAAVFWQSPETPGPRRLLVVGGLFGLAFLSKQPALLDLAAPTFTLLYVAWRKSIDRNALLPRLLALAAGFIAPVLVVFVYLAWQGALDDLIFYTWTYNLKVYGPAIGLGQRLLTVFVPFHLLVAFAPLALVAAIAATLKWLHQLLQRAATPAEHAENPLLVYLMVWLGSSLAAAVSGGRGFEHYYIQWLPPLCLVAGLALAGAGGWAFRRGVWPRLLIGGLLAYAAFALVAGTLAARGRTLSVDPSLRAAKFIRAHTRPEEKIFVWGYQPDIYLHAERKPASRFVYASFVTGLIPWDNVAPDRDTTYAVVPGAMETLLRDLEKNRPAFIVDCSAGPNRYWNKYPLERFPALQDFIQRHYVITEAGQFLPQGFRLFLIRDEFRLHPVALAGGAAGTPPKVEIFAPHDFEPKPGVLLVGASDPAGQVQRIELLVDGKPLDAVSFAPSAGLNVRFNVPFDRFNGHHEFIARATAASGTTADSPVHAANANLAVLAPETIAAFALPQVSGRTPPLSVSAPFGASAEREGDAWVYFAHAPSKIVYPLPPGTVSVRGKTGIRPGAYAPTNAFPSDGAEFVVDWVRPDGSRQTLFRRLLRPKENEDDRKAPFFSAAVPAGAQGQLEFIIGPGPNDSASSDWTYWSDLALETARQQN